MEETEKISTGSFDFNDFLRGGYEKGVVSMIVGGPGTGKTNFAILASCSIARQDKVIFIDTEGGFSVERVKQIVGEGFEKILRNIFLLNPVDFREQRNNFNSLNQYLKAGDVGLVVVDSMAMQYRIELGEAIQSDDQEKIRQVNREIAKQMKVLVEIARKKNIPVLITNQVYSEFLPFEKIGDSEEKLTHIVGGDLFKYWSKCIIELKGKGKNRKAILLKHRSLENKEFNFEIKDLGIFKRSGLF
jgi:DNA repair protein RadB